MHRAWPDIKDGYLFNPNYDVFLQDLLSPVELAARDCAGILLDSLSERDDNMLPCCLLRLGCVASLMCIPGNQKGNNSPCRGAQHSMS